MRFSKFLLFLALFLFNSIHAYANFSCTIDGVRYSYGGSTAKVVGFEAGVTDVVIPKEIVIEESSYTSVPGTYAVMEIRFSNIASTKYKETIKSLSAQHITYCSSMNNCPLLESVDFGSDSDITYIGGFSDCPNLKTVKFGSKLEHLGSFINCKKVFAGGLRLPATIETLGSLKGCTSLKWIDLSACSKLSAIQNNQFEDSGIESINWPDVSQIRYIGEFAFQNCKNLSKVGTLPQSITLVLEGAFKKCSSMKWITLNNAVIKYGGCFSGCVNLTNISLADNQTEIPESTFSGCAMLEKISLPDNIKTIGKKAFYSCISLKGTKQCPFKLSANLTTIGESAFYGCNSLEWVNYVKADNRIVTIEPYAFQNCKKLTEFVVTKKFSDINNISRTDNQNGIIVKANAFYGCSNLTCLPANIISCPTNGFDNVPISAIRLPNYIDEVDNTTVSNLLGTWMASNKISTLFVSEGISNVKSATTQQLYNLENVHFDKYIDEDRPKEMATLNIEANAFSNNIFISSVVCEHLIPPILHPDGFNETTYLNAILEVPDEAINTYKTAEGWKKFKKINGFTNDPESGFEQIPTDETQTDEFFNLQGLKMRNGSLPAGIYIHRQGNKVEKIILK